MAELPAQISFEEFIQSDLFTFLVGEEKKPFVVHSKAIAATSPFFNALVNGGLSEAQTRSAELPDVAPDTFARFLEYAYRREYTVPSWTHDEAVNIPKDIEPEPDVPEVTEVAVEEPPASPPQAVVEPEGEASWNFSTSRLKKIKRKNKMRLKFREQEYLTESEKPIAELIRDFKPIPNSSAYQDFTSVFLAHAQLYTLADMRLVCPLKKLALYKLHSTLSDFSLYKERMGDILELARYAYEQGEDRSDDGSVDELRHLVVSFIACEPKAFGKHKEFKRLMDGEGEFAGDLWDIVSRELL